MKERTSRKKGAGAGLGGKEVFSFARNEVGESRKGRKHREALKEDVVLRRSSSSVIGSKGKGRGLQKERPGGKLEGIQGT